MDSVTDIKIGFNDIKSIEINRIVQNELINITKGLITRFNTSVALEITNITWLLFR